MVGKDTSNHVIVWMRLLSALIVLVALGLISRYHLSTAKLVDIINDLGALAPLGFVFFSACLRMIFMPPMFIVGAAWLMFGVVLGVSYTVLGITCGSCLAFLIGRYYVGEIGITLSEGRVRRTLEKVNEVVRLRGFLTVLGLKLFFSNTGVDYGLSRTEVTFKDYVCGAVVGLMPTLLIHVYLFEAVLRPTLVVTEVPTTDPAIEGLLAEKLMGNSLLEQSFIWLALHVLCRTCGGILLGILANRSLVPPRLLS